MLISGMSKDDILNLEVKDIGNRFLSEKELLHIAITLEAFWQYSKEALENGKPGLHAISKSELHSDGFFVSRILLAPENIRLIISWQMHMLLGAACVSWADYVIGVPNGATELGKDIARLFGTKAGVMEKDKNGKLILKSDIEPGALVLLIEDFCTRGTGFTEAVNAVLSVQPEAVIWSYDPVIINRGGLKEISILNNGKKFTILPLANVRIQDWSPDDCPLCKAGSVAIKPKETDENWRRIITSQL